MIDLDSLTEEQLLELHHRITERLNYLDQLRTHSAMLQFRPGDRVSFTSRDGRLICGALVKYNKKTVTVFADNGQKWNVSPEFLGKEPIEGTLEREGTVVSLKRG